MSNDSPRDCIHCGHAMGEKSSEEPLCDGCKPKINSEMKDGRIINSIIPESIKEHQPKYHEGIRRTYTIQELGMWVHLFLKRAKHRKDKIKARKDVTDAQNYLNMMQAEVDRVRKEVSE